MTIDLFHYSYQKKTRFANAERVFFYTNYLFFLWRRLKFEKNAVTFTYKNEQFNRRPVCLLLNYVSFYLST